MDITWILLIGVVVIIAIIVGISWDVFLDHKEKSEIKKDIERGNNELNSTAHGITVEEMNRGCAPEGLLNKDEKIVSDITLRFKGKQGYIILTDKRILFKCLRYTGTSNNDDVNTHLIEEVCEIPLEHVASVSVQSISRKYYTSKKDIWGNIDTVESGQTATMYLLVINGGGEHSLFMGNNMKVAEMFRKKFNDLRMQ